MSDQILVVDDHEVIRSRVRSLLSSRPEWAICGEAVDGIDAVEKAKALRPDIILMDISMPRMDGLNASRLIRGFLPDSKIVVISQNDPATFRFQAADIKATAFVAKSDLTRDLLPTIDRLIAGPLVENAPDVAQAMKPAPQWLAGGGELGQLIREYDWPKTPLGSIESWPQSLKTSVNLILNSQHPMWIGWGPDATFLYNDAYVQVLSLAKHPLALGKPAAEVWPEIWDICGPLAERVFKKGEASFVDEVRLFMNRGDFLEETYYSFSYSPIRDESGTVAGLFCPSTEVTPKVINARRLRTLSELSGSALVQRTTEAACVAAVATLSRNSDDVPFAALYLFDQESRSLHLEQVSGLPAGTTLLPASIDLDADEVVPSFWPIAEVISAGKSQVVSLRNTDSLPLGLAQQKLHEAIVLPVTSRGEDQPLGILIAGVSPARKLDAEYRTFYDLIAAQIASAIQNARAAEEEKDQLDAMAEIDRAKTAFFSNVSHEFRTPLTLMLGPVEDLLATSHADIPPAARTQLELVSRNGSRLLRLVNTLLDFSRIEAGRMQAIYQETDLAAFTMELASVFRSATERAGLQLELNCPKLDEAVLVDRGMWEKIVLNLLSNAFKFTFEGRITVGLTRSGNNVELRVSDTGVGIASDEIPRLFDRFHRIENTRSRTHEGSGIGLALVQELVKFHGGSVRVESTVGQGSTFIVSVPMGSSHLPAERIGNRSSQVSIGVGAAPFIEEALRWLPDPGSTIPVSQGRCGEEIIPAGSPVLLNEKDGKRPFILLADDNADMRQYLVRLLAERYEVHAVPDGQAALSAVRERVPELLLTDVMMPHLDGFGLLRAMRSDPKTQTIPIIVLSARAGEESRVQGMEYGADDYLIKPFSARELLARVQTHLEMARARKHSEEMLRQHQERFDLVAEASRVGFWFCDLPFDKLIWDDRVKEHFWLPPDAEVTIDTFYERLHPDDRERTRQAITESITNDAPFNIEYRTVSPDGQEKWIRAIGRTFYDAAHQPKRFDGVTLDITESKRTEDRERRMTAEAVAANAKFRAVFEQTTVFAGIMALDGTLIDANQLCLQACGYRAEEVLGRPFWKCGWWQNSGESQDKIEAATKLAREGSPYREILPYHWADGTERVVDFALHPIRDQEGNILFLHPTGVDITELKQAEEKYKNLAETLDVEVRARTQELEQRNVEMLQQSERLRDLSSRLLRAQDEERRRIARELHDSAGQILTALGMNLARIAQHAQQSAAQLAKEANDSQQLVQQLSQEVRTLSYLLHPPLLDEAGLPEALRWYTQGLIERSGLDINLIIGDDVGRLPREMELVMFRLVQECLTNTLRHSGSKHAIIRVAREGQSISLSVEDEGKGMSGTELADLRSRGGGVGMQGMRERVRQFDGQMNIGSNGKGTQVSFRFPVAQRLPEDEGWSQTLRAVS